MVVINGDGEADLIKGRAGLDSGLGASTPGTSPALLPTPKLIISDQIKGILKERSQAKYDTIHEDDNENDVYLCV